MVIEKKFNSINELAALQRMASASEDAVYIASADDSIRVDARSFLGLFTLDFTKPVRVITDSLYVIRMIELDLRKEAAAQVH